MNKVVEILNALIDNIRSLETSLISEISNSRVETEMVLKQLAGYLNISAQNLTDVNNTVTKFNSTMDSFKISVEKIDDVENKLIELPQETFKIKEAMSQQFNDQSKEITKLINTLINYIKKLSIHFSKQNNKLTEIQNHIIKLIESVSLNRKEIRKNQDNLITVINNLIDKNQESDAEELKLKQTELTTDTEKYKIKLGFWIKIIGFLIGSGGVAWLAIDTIFKLIK